MSSLCLSCLIKFGVVVLSLSETTHCLCLSVIFWYFDFGLFELANTSPKTMTLLSSGDLIMPVFSSTHTGHFVFFD